MILSIAKGDILDQLYAENEFWLRVGCFKEIVWEKACASEWGDD